MTIKIEQCIGYELGIYWPILVDIDNHLINKIPYQGYDLDGDTVESFSIETSQGYSWLIRVRNYEDGPYLDVQLLFNGSSVSGVRDYEQKLSNAQFDCVHNNIYHGLLIRDFILP